MPKLVGEDLDPKYVKKVSCPSCARRMEYLQMEVIVESVCCMGDTGIVSYVVCPNCNAHVTVRE